MSIFDQNKNSGVLWVITAASILLISSLGLLGYMIWGKGNQTKPSGEPDTSSVIMSEKPSTIEPSSSYSSQTPPSDSSSDISSSPSDSSVSSYSPPPAATAPVIDITAGQTVVEIGGALQVNSPGLHDLGGTYNSVTISAHGATVADKTVTGDVIIASSVKNGWVVLENLLVKGSIVIEGAGKVTLRNVTAASMTAKRTDPSETAIVLEGETTVLSLIVRHHVSIDESRLKSGYDGIRKVTTMPGIAMWQDVVLIRGALDEFTSNVMSNLTVADGSSVDLVKAEAPTHIGGYGRVERLVVKNDDVTYSLKPRTIETTPGYLSAYANSTPIGHVPENSYDSDDQSMVISPYLLGIREGSANNLIFEFSHSGTGVSQFAAECHLNGALIDSADLANSFRAWSVTPPALSLGDVIKFSIRAESVNGAAYNSPIAQKLVTVNRIAQPSGLSITAGEVLSFSFNPVSGAEDYTLIPFKDGTALAPIVPIDSSGRMTAVLAGAGSGTYHFTVRANVNTLLFRDSLTTQSASVDITKIAAPTGALTASQGSVTLTLDALPGAVSYQVWCNGAPAASSDGSGLVFTLPALQPGNYIFTARALGDGLTTINSDIITIGTHIVTKLDPPGNLSLTYSGGTYTASFDASYGALDYDAVLQKNGASVALTKITSTVYEAVSGIDEGDQLQLSVTALGDNIALLDSVAASISRTVSRLVQPLGLTFAADGNGKAVFGFSRIDGAASYIISYVSGGNEMTRAVVQPGLGMSVSYTADFDADSVSSFKIKAIGSDFALDSYWSSTLEIYPLSVPTLTISADKQGAVNKINLSFSPDPDNSYEVRPLTIIGASHSLGDPLVYDSGANIYSWTLDGMYAAGNKLGFSIEVSRAPGAGKVYLSKTHNITLEIGADLLQPTGLSVEPASGETLLSFSPVEGASGYDISIKKIGDITESIPFSEFSLNPVGKYEAQIGGLAVGDILEFSVTARGNDYFTDNTAVLTL